jgi:UDP-N-acetylglucosamine 2-epimerase (non-hydrolysing)
MPKKMEIVNKRRVMTIVGTRPEIIRLSRIIPLLDEHFEHKLVHTGQNFTKTLSDIFFDELEIREPDAFLHISSDSLGESLGNLFSRVEKEFITFAPDALVVLGDTNSALATIVARRMNIPTFHLEAGNRSFDANVPEEVNRKIVDHTADFNLVYSEHARRNLIAEGLNPRFIGLMGSPLNEVLNYYRPKIESSEILDKLHLTTGNYFLASVHRQENVDSVERLSQVASALNSLTESYKLPVLLSLHPRTKSKLDQYGIRLHPDILISEPFGFLDYCKLQLNARLTISDSGSISEEAALLGTRAVTLRNSMERPEAMEAGSLILVGIERSDLLQVLESALTLPLSKHQPDDYLISDSSARVVRFILSSISEHKFWMNIR